jgi:ribonucleoside-diphosphate reductase alpha chain
MGNMTKFKRPETLHSTTTKVPTGYGNLYVTITEHDGKPFEIFCSIGKSGASTMAKAEVTGRLASLALRNGVPVESVIKELLDISGGENRAWKNYIIKSIPDAVGRVLSEKYLNKEVNKDAL